MVDNDEVKYQLSKLNVGWQNISLKWDVKFQDNKWHCLLKHEVLEPMNKGNIQDIRGSTQHPHAKPSLANMQADPHYMETPVWYLPPPPPLFCYCLGKKDWGEGQHRLVSLRSWEKQVGRKDSSWWCVQGLVGCLLLSNSSHRGSKQREITAEESNVLHTEIWGIGWERSEERGGVSC